MKYKTMLAGLALALAVPTLSIERTRNSLFDSIEHSAKSISRLYHQEIGISSLSHTAVPGLKFRITQKSSFGRISSSSLSLSDSSPHREARLIYEDGDWKTLTNTLPLKYRHHFTNNTAIFNSIVDELNSSYSNPLIKPIHSDQ